MKRVLTILLTLVFLFTLCSCFGIENHAYASAFQADFSSEPSFWQDFINLFGVNDKKQDSAEKVYLGGYPLGITVNGDGVTVIGLNEFINEEGSLCCPALDSGIQINDKITSIDGVTVHSSESISRIVRQSDGKKMTFDFIRKETKMKVVVKPQIDLATKQYRVGLFTRDCSSGIGTLTFVKQNMEFAALGHPICNTKGKISVVKNGSVFTCRINGVERSQNGRAGELKGSFSYEDKIGVVHSNTPFGVYGKLASMPYSKERCVEIALPDEVIPGKAYVYTTVNGTSRECYEIDIVKVVSQTEASDRGLVIRITDDELLKKTSGIVQGMSGSPIVQNGKLVGAITHVFVNNPAMGYGIFAKWMVQE